MGGVGIIVTEPEAPCLRYVLSAGRTGTVFLARLLNSQPGIVAAHEPDSSRYQMMLANLRNDWGAGGGMLKRWFERSRARRIEAAGGRAYVEINPFLCPMTDLLPMPGHQLKIVHMVRDPATWAVSIIAHKASERFREIIDYVPFGKPYPVPRPTGWNKLESYERALWRWNWCNSRIGELQSVSEAFAVVRYEDLFAQERELRAAALHSIVKTLDLPDSTSVNGDGMGDRANASSSEGVELDRSTPSRICGALARTYGYDY